MVHRIFWIGALVITCAALGVAQQSATKGTKTPEKAAQTASLMTLRGYVVDAMCAKGMVGKENVMKRAAAHTKVCALEEACSASGYGIFADGKWYKFDAAGDKKAKGMIGASPREKGLAFKVMGRQSKDYFAVSSLEEINIVSEKSGAGKEAHQYHHD